MILVIAIMFGTINIVGGFLVTDRMLEMFKSKPKPAAEADPPPAAQAKLPSAQAGPPAAQGEAPGEQQRSET